MSKKSPNKKYDGSESTAAALTTLANTVLALLKEGSLDAQFAEKLSRRIGREASDASFSEKQLPEHLGLSLKLQELDSAVTQTKANGLVAAMVDLRRADANGDVFLAG
jgi:hypothetical protein